MDEINGLDVLNFIASAHTNAAEHTSIGIKVEKRIGVVNGQFFLPHLQPLQPLFVEADMISRPLQRTLGVLETSKAVCVVVCYEQFQVYLPGFIDFRGFCSDYHSGFDWCFAGDCRLPSVNFYEAKPAGADRFQFTMVAKVRNINPFSKCRIQYGHAAVGRNRQAVYCEFDFLRHLFPP
jgi:hypothetical protein